MARSITPEEPAAGVSSNVSTSLKAPARGTASQLSGLALGDTWMTKEVSGLRRTVQALRAPGRSLVARSGVSLVVAE